jgi:hypothetical protein
LRSGLVRGAGVGEALVFKTNTSLSTNGTERMRLTNAGNLGIGTDVPAAPLSVCASSGGGLEIVPAGGSSITQAYNRATGQYIENVLRGSVLSFYTGQTTTERMRIDTNGRVGIGTASPTAILQVGGADGTLPGLFVDQTGTDAATLSKDLAELSVRSPAQVKCAGTSTLELFVGGLSGPVNNLPVGIQASNAAGTTPYNLSLSPFGGYVGVGLGLSAATSMLDVRTGVGKRQWARFLVADSGGKTAAARIRGDSSYTGFLAQFDTDSVTANSGYGLSIQVGNLTQTTATSLAIDAATSSTNATLVSTFSVYGDGRVYARGPVQSGTNITTSSPSTYLTTKQYVDSREYTFSYGFANVLDRYTAVGIGTSDIVNETLHFSKNYFDVFPPSGKSMNSLIAFIPSIGRVYYAGGVDGNDSLHCQYKIKTDRIRVWVFNTENRANSSGNWLAVWR